ncbi:histidine kinase, HAMP region domain protein [Rhodovulum sp. PH10]|uniref:HAMP domain-containing protein n=1 Tax=Rhodovulum sp. PH10 TaxID=1187851 RepID=UPI00027C2771|nr:HAMP domain-containing protein [Rhodovulum sp. PH10]EJW12683.1 histidine kinase, HAMP region domain protein [Rhodovulum sp. PH10]
MPGLSNGGLGQKLSMLVMGVALVVAVAIGGVGDVMLRRLASDLDRAQPQRLAALERLVNQGGATVTPVIGGDGRVVGMVVMQKDAGPAVIPASLVPQGSVQRAAVEVAPLAETGDTIASMRKNLLFASLLVLVVVGALGMQLAGGFVEPLGRLARAADRLASGETDVAITARERTDEIGRLARATATLQERMVELERLKAERATAPASTLGPVVGTYAEMLASVGAALGRATELPARFGAHLARAGSLAASEGKLAAGAVGRGIGKLASVGTVVTDWSSWKAWLTDETPARA